jgi:bifunctional ADP-heptose synthase (sugar kinase/adenylyltransferase)
MAADSQSSSQVGDISRFQKMLLITPTEHEARLACRDFSSGLVSLVDRLKKSSEAEHVLVTLGRDGVLVHDPDNFHNEICTDQLPALNPNPRDVAGAGDSLLSCAAMAMVLGANVFEAAYLGSVAAAVQVGRIGNVPISPEELMEKLHQ